MAGRNDVNQRRQYRVSAVSAPDLSVRIEWGGSGFVEVSLRDTSGRGIGVVIPSSQTGGLSRGLAVRGELIDRQIEREIPFPAVVRYLGPLDGQPDLTQLGLELSDPTGLIRRLDPARVHLFNRRQFFRVRPSLTMPLEATVRTDATTCGPPVHDVSLAGLSLAMTKTMAREFSAGQDVAIRVHVGANAVPRDVAGRVVHVSETRIHLRCGLEFQEDGSQDLRSTQHEIGRFVVERQREDRLRQ